MAGIVIGDFHLRLRERFAEADPRKEDAHINHTLSKRVRSRFVRRAAKNEVVFVHGGSTARRIRQDGIKIVGEGGEIALREILRGSEIARVPGETSAASLCRGHM